MPIIPSTEGSRASASSRAAEQGLRALANANTIKKGLFLVFSGLSACAPFIASPTAAAPIPPPFSGADATPTPTGVAPGSPTEGAAKKTETPPPSFLTGDRFVQGLSGIGGGDAVVEVPTPVPGGKPQPKEVKVTDLFTYASSVWGQPFTADSLKDPVQAYKFSVAVAEYTGLTGVIDLSKIFPQLNVKAVRFQLNKLPNGQNYQAVLNAKPQNLTLYEGANNQGPYIIVMGVAGDVSGAQAIFAVDNYLIGSSKGNPRLIGGALGLTMDPAIQKQYPNATSLTDLLALNGVKFDRTTGTITLPDGSKTVLEAFEGGFGNKIMDSMGMLYVPYLTTSADGTPQLLSNPIVLPSADFMSQPNNGATLVKDANGNLHVYLMDLNNKPLAEAKYNGKTNQWEWGKIIDPQVEFKNYLQSADAKSAIEQYAKAFGVPPESVKLNIKGYKDKTGNQFALAMTQDGTRLMIWENGAWRKTTLRDFAIKVGIGIGTSVDGSEQYQNTTYRNTVTDNFNYIMPDGSFAMNTLKKYGPNMAMDFAKLAFDNGIGFRILSAFHIDDVPYSGDLSTREKVDQFMRSRLEQLLDPAFIKPGSKTELVVVHESTIQDWGDGKEHWNGEWIDPNNPVRNPYFDAYGKDWPIKAYQLAYQIAQQKGLVVGKDVIFAFSDYDFLQNSTKAAMVDGLLIRIRNGVAADTTLKLKPEDVKINVIDQTHMHADKENKRGWNGIYTHNVDAATITQNVKTFSQFGDVEMSEIDISGTTDMNEKADDLATIVDIGVKAGVKRFDFYEPLRFDPKKSETFSLFNADFTRSIVYYHILAKLLQNAQLTQ